MNTLPLAETGKTGRERCAEVAAAALAGTTGRVLKTDAYNEANCDPSPGGIVGALPSGCRVILLDNDPEMIRKATLVGKDIENAYDIQEGTIEAVPFPRDTFEAVVDCSTIDHVDDYQQVLREYYRVLKTGGKLVLFSWVTDGLTTERLTVRGFEQRYFPAEAYRKSVDRLFDGEWREMHKSRLPFEKELEGRAHILEFVGVKRDRYGYLSKISFRGIRAAGMLDGKVLDTDVYLDLGCGRAPLLEELVKRGTSYGGYYAVDPMPLMDLSEEATQVVCDAETFVAQGFSVDVLVLMGVDGSITPSATVTLSQAQSPRLVLLEYADTLGEAGAKRMADVLSFQAILSESYSLSLRRASTYTGCGVPDVFCTRVFELWER